MADHKAQTLDELAQVGGRLSAKNVLVGFDGFVDKIVHPVDQRYGPGSDFAPIETIEAFGQRIGAAAGKSANIELYQRTEKLGGNGPIMANAMLSAGCQTRYIGALGKPDIHPVFKDFAEKTKAVSLTNPGITTAAEFRDGKIMLGDMASLDEVNFGNMEATMGEGNMLDTFSRADLIASVNWTMLPYLTDFFNAMVDRIFSTLGPKDQRLFFFDLADPAKRSKEDLRSVLHVIKRFMSHGNVTLGLNLSEAVQAYEVLGYSPGESEADDIKRMATRIRNELDLSMVIVHPTEGAACATRDDAFWVTGPYTPNPRITTGAGDHFNAGFMCARLLGLSTVASLTVAVSFSGYYVRNAKSPTLSEVSRFIREWN